MKTISYPKVGQTKDLKVFVSFYLNNQRYRLYNGKRIGSLLEPNSFPEDQRIYQGNILAAEIYKRTGSLSKLRKAMGHSSLTVSLTYLRGLEVSELKKSDMPMV
jgi:hypothetical protein